MIPFMYVRICASLCMINMCIFYAIRYRLNYTEANCVYPLLLGYIIYYLTDSSCNLMPCI